MTRKTETRTDKLRAAHDKLQKAVAEITSGDDWKRMLKVASKFHNYSGGGITYSIPLNSPDQLLGGGALPTCRKDLITRRLTARDVQPNDPCQQRPRSSSTQKRGCPG